MTRVEFQGVSGKRLAKLNLTLESGVSSVLVGWDLGVPEIVEFASGFSRPRAGKVRVDGRDPYAEPELRKRIALLLDAEPPFEQSTVADAVSAALRARDCSLGARDVLRQAELASWSDRRTTSLSPDENRSVALAIALSVERPLLAALVEPFGTAIPRGIVLNAVRRFSAEGATVLCATASQEDAADLSGRVLVVDRRRRKSEVTERNSVAEPAGLPELVVRANEAAKLASILAADPDVSAVSHDEAAAPRVVIVSGPDVEQVSLAVLRVARMSGIVIAAIEPRVPGPRSSTRVGSEPRP